jgi:hypothetical protein
MSSYLIKAYQKTLNEYLDEVNLTENRLIDLTEMSIDLDTELKEIAFLLGKLSNNLTQLEEGIVRDEHIRRHSALELRQNTLLKRKNVNIEPQIAEETKMLEVYKKIVEDYKKRIADEIAADAAADAVAKKK